MRRVPCSKNCAWCFRVPQVHEKPPDPAKRAQLREDHERLKGVRVTDLASLAKASASTLEKAGIGENEARDVLTEARITYHSQVLKRSAFPR